MPTEVSTWNLGRNKKKKDLDMNASTKSLEFGDLQVEFAWKLLVLWKISGIWRSERVEVALNNSKVEFACEEQRLEFGQNVGTTQENICLKVPSGWKSSKEKSIIVQFKVMLILWVKDLEGPSRVSQSSVLFGE